MFTDTTPQSMGRIRGSSIREGSCCSCTRTGRTKGQKNLLAKKTSTLTSDLQDGMGKTYFFVFLCKNMGNTDLCHSLQALQEVLMHSES